VPSRIPSCADIAAGATRSVGSDGRFPDGGAWRIEIPSVEGPAALSAVLDEAARIEVPVHRVSQGSGVMMLRDAEIEAMLSVAGDYGTEVCLFLGPRGTWDIGAGTKTTSGGAGSRARGIDQVTHSIDDARRACDLGIRNLLVADEGVLWSLHLMRTVGELPSDLRLKLSVLVGPANPIGFQVAAGLGADSINVQGDLTMEQVAQMRLASPATLDLYLEAPDDLGGYVRLTEAAELIRVAAPVYVKFGLRNAPVMYPTGKHLEELAMATGVERVRRARLTLDLLERSGGAPLPMSPVGDPTLPVPPRFVLSDG